MARLRERQRAGETPARYRRPKDRRSRPQQWGDAVGTLLDCLDAYQAWRGNLPAGVADSAMAERLDAVLELRDLVTSWKWPSCLAGLAETEGKQVLTDARN